MGIVQKAEISIPINAVGMYFGMPGPWVLTPLSVMFGMTGDANSPGFPFSPLQMGGCKYQENGEWQRSDWDGRQWIPLADDFATGDFKNRLDADRKKLLDMSEAERQKIERDFRDALPLTGGVGPAVGVGIDVNACFRDAKGWRQPVDPLMLDLDGDGLELRGANGTVLFDHDADGIRTGTGWISADDGILVRDVSGNGLIDSGRELFGVDTLKRNGQRAVNGFDALADLDSNADGNFTNADAAWNEVKVWRDQNQDGISGAGELFSLNQLGSTASA